MNLNGLLHPIINLNGLVFTSSDYKLGLSLGLITIPVLTLEEVKYTITGDLDYTYIIGSTEPVSVKTNNSSYKGTLIMQSGELEALLALNGFVFVTQVINGTISIVALANNERGSPLVKVFRNVVFTEHSGGTKAKDKDSKVTLNWASTNAVGI